MCYNQPKRFLLLLIFHMNTLFFKKIKSFSTKKKIIWGLVFIITLSLIFWFIFGGNGSNGDIQTEIAKIQDIKKTVLTTGQVVSKTDLSLSFLGSGVVRQINVKEGDVVYTGQVLAVLDQGTALASLKSAQGALAQAQANYNKILAAATPEDIAVSQSAVDVASISLSSAKQNLINQLTTAYNNANTVVLSDTNILFSNPQSPSPQFGVSGTVQTNQQLVGLVNNQRVAINSILQNWQTELLTVNENNVAQVVTNSLNNLSVISNYLKNIIDLLSGYTQITTGGSQTTINTYITSVVSGKSTVDTASTSIITY